MLEVKISVKKDTLYDISFEFTEKKTAEKGTCESTECENLEVLFHVLNLSDCADILGLQLMHFCWNAADFTHTSFFLTCRYNFLTSQ